MSLTLDEGVNTVPLLLSPSFHHHSDQELVWASKVSLNTVKNSCRSRELNPGFQPTTKLLCIIIIIS